MEQANELFAHLAKQADLIFEWRLSMRDLLVTPLTSEDGPADGEEYGETLDVQTKAVRMLSNAVDVSDPLRRTHTCKSTLRCSQIAGKP